MCTHLLILDLDETLIYGVEEQLGRPADFMAGPFHIYRRPHLSNFLAGCLALFETALWTSASPVYVDKRGWR